MTYEQAKGYFWCFKGIETANQVNNWFALNRVEKDFSVALRYYMAERGCLSFEGKFETWYEINNTTHEISIAKISTDGFIGPSAIVKKSMHFYTPAYGEWEAYRKFFRMKGQIFQIKGRVADVMPMESGVGQHSGVRWKRLTFAVEDEEGGDTPIALTIHGERAESLKPTEGTRVRVDFVISSNKRNDRYFTELKVVNIMTI